VKPIVLCFSGHDVTGGAGVQADIEAIGANGAQAMTVITASTLQNTAQFVEFEAMKPDWVYRQVDMILTEFTPQAVKIGMLANNGIASVVKDICSDLGVPVVLDPILKSGNNGAMAVGDLVSGIEGILPYTTVLTPNAGELEALGGVDKVMLSGCANVLLTQTDVSSGNTVTHTLYGNEHAHDYKYPRLPGVYHGSGCTLASSIAAQLALGNTISNGVKKALDYTWQCLNRSEISGSKQALPNRYE
jgi:hydroxymethylpyrimidine/phosphomethylpyrimidine kinase